MVGGVISLIASADPYCRSVRSVECCRRPLPSTAPPLPTGEVILGPSCKGEGCWDELLIGRPPEPEEGAMFDEPTAEGPVELDAVEGPPDPKYVEEGA